MFDQTTNKQTKMEQITFPTENTKHKDCPGYIPKDHARVTSHRVGVIVVQEWWGVNEQIKHRAQEFFEKCNWITLVPDLYRGKVAIDHEEAGHLMTGLDFPNAVADIQGAAKYLKEKLNCQKVGVVGFCMGGALALASAVVPNNQIDAASAYYGIPSPEIFSPSNINIPAIAHFGNEDAMKGFSAPEDVDKLEKSIKEAGKNVTIYRYDGAGHAFDHEGGPNYNKSASELAEERTAEFFKKHL